MTACRSHTIGLARFCCSASCSAGATSESRRAAALVEHRHPGPTQHTSRRVAARLLEHLDQGGQITLAIATSATIQGGDHAPTSLALKRKTARVLAEHAALSMEYLRNETTLPNLGNDTNDRDVSVP